MKKGVIMDIEREYLTMLTPEGEFIKTKNQNENYQLGDELVFFPLHEEEVSRRSIKSILQIRTNKVKWISALTAILLLVSFIPAYLNEDVYAYMSIDINPSFEIGLDRNLEVIEIDALNEEAKLILQQVDEWKNKHVDTVTDTIIGKSRENGYLNEGKEIIITTVIEEDKLDDEIDELQDHLHEDLMTLSNSYKEENIVITTIKSNEETREIAKEQGISTGKLIQQEKQKQQVKNGKQKETSKENVDMGTTNEDNETNQKKNTDHKNEKQIEKSQKQENKNERKEQLEKQKQQKEQRKQQREQQKQQQKQQRDQQKQQNKNQKGKSDDVQIKKENGKAKAIEVKDHKNNERGNNKKDNKANERKLEKEKQQQKRLENRREKHQEKHREKDSQHNHHENKGR